MSKLSIFAICLALLTGLSSAFADERTVQIASNASTVVVKDGTRILVLNGPRASGTRIQLGDVRKRRGAALEIFDWSSAAGDLLIGGQGDQTINGRPVWTVKGAARLVPVPQLNGWAIR